MIAAESVGESEDSFDSQDVSANKKRRGERGCWGNYGLMCCNKKVKTQQELLHKYSAKSSTCCEWVIKSYDDIKSEQIYKQVY